MNRRRSIDAAQIVGALLGAVAGWLIATYGPFRVSTTNLILWSAAFGSFAASWRGFVEAGEQLLGDREINRFTALLVALLASAALFLVALLIAVLVGYLLHRFGG